jgi:hypothetical protein
MFYCGTNQKLQFYLSGAVTTNELPYVSTAITTADTVASKNGVSNGVTAVDLCNAAAGLVRHFEIYNADTTDATIYVIYNDNGTTRIVHQEVIQSGYTLVYDSESGWAVTPSQSGLVSHAIDGAAHTVAGRTAGQVLRATSANTFGWSTATYPGTVESGTLLVATSTNAIGTLGVGLTTQVLVGGGAATVPSWSTDLPTALTIGGAYIYRAGGTDVAIADGGTGLSTLGTANQLLGVNNDATGLEYKSLLGTTNQITVTHAAGSITFALPQNIHTTATPTFGAINLGSASGAGNGDVFGSGVLQMNGTGTHYVLGNFAVGTAAPTAKLDIVPSSSSDVVFRTKSLQSTAPLGSELVSNGNFSTVPDTSWTWGTGWTHDTTNLEADHTTGNTAALTQNISVINGQTYQVEITIRNRTAGSVTLDINGVYIYDYGTSNTLSSNTTYKRSLVANITGTATLSITPTSDFNGSVDDISVKQITGVSQPNFSLLDDEGSVVAELRGKGSLDSVAIGVNALRYNTTGYRNSAIGASALYSNTTGYWNSAIGANALYSNTTGFAIGILLLERLRMLFTPIQLVSRILLLECMLYANTTGYWNSAIGANALYSNTTGYQNSAIGASALYSNTTGYRNSAIGANALYSNTTGYWNSAIGVNALYSNTTGYWNSAIGVNALYSNTTGYSNSAIGASALYSNTTGYSFRQYN